MKPFDKFRILESSDPTVDKCVLFGPFSYIVQSFLAFLSFTVLIFKRYRENPRRPWKVWFFDVSKQICSACTQHLLNLIMSVFLSEDTTADECIWYFLNFFLDTTIGVLICYTFMKLLECIVQKYQINFLKSGFYFEEIKRNNKIYYRIKMKMYFSQLMSWLTIIIINKFLMFGLNHLCKDYFEAVGNFILKPFVFNHKVELLMVMIVFPLLFNAIQFWVFDEILKFNINPESDRNLLNAQIIDDDSESNLNPSDQITELGKIQTPPQRTLTNQSTETPSHIQTIKEEIKLDEKPMPVIDNKDNSVITNSTEIPKEEQQTGIKEEDIKKEESVPVPANIESTVEESKSVSLEEGKNK